MLWHVKLNNPLPITQKKLEKKTATLLTMTCVRWQIRTMTLSIYTFNYSCDKMSQNRNELPARLKWMGEMHVWPFVPGQISINLGERRSSGNRKITRCNEYGLSSLKSYPFPPVKNYSRLTFCCLLSPRLNLVLLGGKKKLATLRTNKV